MKFNFKEYSSQDNLCEGPMRRRYDQLVDIYNGYSIYKYVRGEFIRFSAQDDNGNIFVETDNFDEVKSFIDSELNS